MEGLSTLGIARSRLWGSVDGGEAEYWRDAGFAEEIQVSLEEQWVQLLLPLNSPADLDGLKNRSSRAS